MNELNEKRYYELLKLQIENTVKRNNISVKEFNENFIQIVAEAHKSIQNGFLEIINNKEKLGENIYSELANC